MAYSLKDMKEKEIKKIYTEETNNYIDITNMSNIAGISNKTLDDFLNGKTSPKEETLELLRKNFDEYIKLKEEFLRLHGFYISLKKEIIDFLSDMSIGNIAKTLDIKYNNLSRLLSNKYDSVNTMYNLYGHLFSYMENKIFMRKEGFKPKEVTEKFNRYSDLRKIFMKYISLCKQDKE